MLPEWVSARTVMVCSPKRSIYKVRACMHQLQTISSFPYLVMKAVWW